MEVPLYTVDACHGFRWGEKNEVTGEEAKMFKVGGKAAAGGSPRGCAALVKLPHRWRLHGWVGRGGPRSRQ